MWHGSASYAILCHCFNYPFYMLHISEHYLLLNVLLYHYRRPIGTSEFRGGSIKKTNELKPKMKRVNTMRELRSSAFRLTSVIPSFWPVFEEASSSFSIGHVKNPYAIPVQSAPRCAQSSIGPRLLSTQVRAVAITAFWNKPSDDSSFAFSSLFWFW